MNRRNTAVLLLFGFFIATLASGAALLHRALILNPYSPFGLKLPITTTVTPSDTILVHIEPIAVITTPTARFLSFITNGVRIFGTTFLWKEAPLTGTENEIIAQIHAERFNPNKPYVITGGHYSDLFVRNLGIFYHSLLDDSLANLDYLPNDDALNRQRIALQTVALNLTYLDQSPAPVTTVSPIGPNTITGLNIYAYPSDSLYGIFFTLNRLQAIPTTASASATLLELHQDSLSLALNHYLATILDPATNLVRTDVTLSSARDGVTRKSSFYDNVSAWATVQQADQLGIAHTPTPTKEVWKQNIIDQFWRPNTGIFTDQLVDEQPTFSADSLIVTSTGFLQPNQASEAAYLQQMSSYIQNKQLDKPFPLRYAANTNTSFQPVVGLFAPRYMTSGIWSHWGMEYLALLAELGTDIPTACKHLNSYSQNIRVYGGYPELYNQDGSIYSSPFLNSVLHSGWVVNYERVKILLDPLCTDF